MSQPLLPLISNKKEISGLKRNIFSLPLFTKLIFLHVQIYDGGLSNVLLSSTKVRMKLIRNWKARGELHESWKAERTCKNHERKAEREKKKCLRRNNGNLRCFMLHASSLDSSPAQFRYMAIKEFLLPYINNKKSHEDCR